MYHKTEQKNNGKENCGNLCINMHTYPLQASSPEKDIKISIWLVPNFVYLVSSINYMTSVVFVVAKN
jgi:hypothetical protein